MASNPKLSVQVRPARDSDVDRILEIERAAPSAAHWPQSDYQIALSGTSPRRMLLVAELVAEIDGHVDGFLVARSLIVTEWEIENVVVAERARKSGLGRALISAFLEQVRPCEPLSQDLVVYLEVRESNVAARQLYEKSGFHLDNRRRAYYRFPEEDAVVYCYSFQ